MHTNPHNISPIEYPLFFEILSQLKAKMVNNCLAFIHFAVMQAIGGDRISGGVRNFGEGGQNKKFVHYNKYR